MKKNDNNKFFVYKATAFGTRLPACSTPIDPPKPRITAKQNAITITVSVIAIPPVRSPVSPHQSAFKRNPENQFYERLMSGKKRSVDGQLNVIHKLLWETNDSSLNILIRHVTFDKTIAPLLPIKQRNSGNTSACLFGIASLSSKFDAAKRTKDSPLTPTVIQGMIMFDNNVADITTSSTMSPINCTTVVYAFPEEDRVVVGYINEWINAYSFISKNQEKFYLYIIVSVTAGILIFLGLVIGRLLISRHRAKRDAKFHANNEALPNGFTDDISEIDADIDLTTPVPVPMQDTRLPETQLAERLHGDRYYAETRIPMSPTTMHPAPGHYPGNTGVRVDLGNHMFGLGLRQHRDYDSLKKE
ncbi:hypothetical protein WN51_02133 [Melipona quadrifasciata]|uniref:Uncharacterized protein n=1 Tax=Melipona quadrifasciata TaxID=166423 RepID=A0A0M8ZW23_9HYME|nr:hypothetical protein WN51_02133 [Melipona quadrifasciata]